MSPYVGFSFGTYTEGKLVSGFGDWEPIPNKGTHTLVTLGVRVGWDFGGTPRGEAAAPSSAPGA